MAKSVKNKNGIDKQIRTVPSDDEHKIIHTKKISGMAFGIHTAVAEEEKETVKVMQRIESLGLRSGVLRYQLWKPYVMEVQYKKGGSTFSFKYPSASGFLSLKSGEMRLA